ncbi:glycosyltransferase [Tamlana fucoidanivorans]|uniref:Glycosyltransferase n=1 Tax=Allotamlana fucoidanivorans TaxID=2583814 RepID=A0A5C4SQH9_9FLAO|nr:glycosyltransferase family 2 protein [Tamlana fucoidanivorans]TNJ46532.1 glycosyltransferase [Tamlana fucoidanivorans]
MKLSILIPMYNAEKYIGNCITSLINQDVPKDDYEILVLDDGSVDDSVKIVQEFIHVNDNIHLYTQSNKGLYATRNKLLRLAKGIYIYNIDADDYIVYNSLSLLLDRAFEYNADIVGFNSLKTRQLDLFKSNSEKETEIMIYKGIDFLSKTKHFNITVWWYFVRKDFIYENSIYFEEDNPFEDGPFSLRAMFYAKKIIYLPIDVHRYVQVPSSIMNNNSQNHSRRIIDDYINVTYSFNKLLAEFSNKKKNIPHEILNKVKFFRDVNIYYMFFRIIKANISIKKVDGILNEFETLGAYPISYFIENKLHKTTIYLFNHKYLFYTFLYPLRILYKSKVLKFF